MARHFGLTVTPWSPLGGGVLTGRYLDGGGGRLSENAKQRSPENLPIARAVVDVAREAGCTPAQAALAWLRGRGPDVVPIVGASTVDQLRDNLGALDVTLSADQTARLDEASRVSLGFPHDFLAGAMTRDRVYGALRDAIDR
jgi:aryl-alcohol dehydrogenase-like predicted oxidoreductase